jgi:putative chitinase
MITKDQLAKLIKSNTLSDKYYQAIVDECAKGKIIGKLRECAFLAQILHESGNLAFTKELTGHTTHSMRTTWPRIFPTDESTLLYLHKPEALFNYIYGTGKLGRDLGNTSAGDGWKYIGRGLLGTTGKANYQQLTNDTGIDFVNHPELLEQPHYALMSAVNFWNKYNLSAKADLGDFKGITQRINGGQIGAANREENYKKLLELYA